MTADVTDLLASIDDVLRTASEPVVVSVEPVEPEPVVEPVVSVEPVVEPVPVERDWWDSLYKLQAQEVEAEAVASVGESRVSAEPRLPYWWQKPQQKAEQKAEPPRAEPADTADTADTAKGKGKCSHARLLALRAEGGHGDVVSRLCLDCDERLPATDPEDPAECEHEERLEARAPSGKLIGYVCQGPKCGARLDVSEVQGRAGKWLRPRAASEYYPLPRNPFAAPAPVEGGEETKPALSPGTRRLLANASAAGVGYWTGLVPLIQLGIEECGQTISIGGALFLGAGICLVVGHFWDRKTRHWYRGLAWVARIPLASAITAIALYAPASQI